MSNFDVNSNENLFDRQIRIFGHDSQKSLANAHICFIEISAVTLEIIKECFLCGIGSITLVSDAIVEQNSPINSNFFFGLNKDTNKNNNKNKNTTKNTNTNKHNNTNTNNIGKYIVDVLPKNMDSINHCTQVQSINKNVRDIFRENEMFFCQFNVVVFSQLASIENNHLLELLYENNVHVLDVSILDGVGMIIPQYNHLPILNPSPDYKPTDLRLLNPFEELVNFQQSFELQTKIPNEPWIIPFPILVLDIIDEYKNLSGSFECFTKTIQGDLLDLLKTKYSCISTAKNYNEAVNHLKTGLGHFSTNQIPENISTILLNYESKLKGNFDKMMHVLTKFIDVYGRFPYTLEVLDDMSASTAYYNKLKELYRNRFLKDIDCMLYLIGNKTNSDPSLYDDVTLFCKNLFCVDFLHTQLIPHQISECLRKSADTKINDFINSLFINSLTNRNNEEKSMPNSSIQPEETIVLSAISSAHIGGIATAEIIKLCTKRYLPINSLIFIN